jgi:DNA-binding transcriptional MocR family regulator
MIEPLNSPVARAFAYQLVYRYLSDLVAEANGEQNVRLPSLRDLARRLGVSVSTVQHAYEMLEGEGRIYSVAKSGYFAAVAPQRISQQPPLEDLLDSVHASASRPGLLAMHRSAPWPGSALGLPLTRQEREVQRQHPEITSGPLGEAELRRELALRYTRCPQQAWQAEHVYLGTDLRAIIDLAFDALDVRGKNVLFTSPLSPMLLQALRRSGAKSCELPLDSSGRLDLVRITRRLRSGSVALVVLSSTLNGAQGTVLPEEQRQALASLLNEHGTALLEDDDHADLCFTPVTPLRELVEPSQVLVCGSFARTIGAEAPYGYLLARSHGTVLRSRFLERGFHLPPLRQKAIARLYQRGAIQQCLPPLRARLQRNLAHVVQQLSDALDDCATLAMPAGGTGIWLHSRHGIASREVYQRLLEQRILVAPGEMFSTAGHHHHSLRVACPVDGLGLPARVLMALRKALRQSRG